MKFGLDGKMNKLKQIKRAAVESLTWFFSNPACQPNNHSLQNEIEMLVINWNFNQILEFLSKIEIFNKN